MTFSSVRITCFIAAFLAATSTAPIVRGQDASIDRLLSKLPPPEKLVKPPVQRALEQPDPAIKDAIVGQVAHSLAARNTQQALVYSRKLTERYPRSAAAQFLRGALALDVHQFAEAATSFRTAAQLQPNMVLAPFGLALVEGSSQGHFAAAMPHLRRVAKLEPNSYVPWFALSDCASHLGRKQEALDYARKATEKGPSSAYAWLQLARAEKALGHTEATLNALTKGAEVSPDSAEMLAVVGFGYVNLNRLQQAIPPLERAARLAPRDFLVHSQLGYCLVVVGQTEAGIAHLRTGASLAPKNYGPVWEHLGLAYQKQGRHQDAVKAFEKATQLMPTSPLPWQHLSQEYLALGRAEDAKRAAAHVRSLPSRTVSAKQKKL